MNHSLPAAASPQPALLSPAAAVLRGVCRLLDDAGLSPLAEFTLANGRRLDVAALGPDGSVTGIEIKVSRADLAGDLKWPDYLDFCDRFYFAGPESLADAPFPASCGLILADRWGGAIIRESPLRTVAPARRKAVTLRFARAAALRLARLGALVPEASGPDSGVPR